MKDPNQFSIEYSNQAQGKEVTRNSLRVPLNKCGKLDVWKIWLIVIVSNKQTYVSSLVRVNIIKLFSNLFKGTHHNLEINMYSTSTSMLLTLVKRNPLKI